MDKDIQEEIIKSETIHQGKNFSFKKNVVKLLNNKITSREIVNHPGAVGIIPLLNNEVIMVEQYRSAIQKMLLEIPAGTINQNEDPLECAKRELLEETGYYSENMTKLIEGFTAPGYSSEKIYIFLAKKLTFKGTKLEDDELIKTRKIKLRELEKMIVSNEVEDMKTICGIQRLKDYINNEDTK